VDWRGCGINFVKPEVGDPSIGISKADDITVFEFSEFLVAKGF
jgi:hypothetical protein